jgi:hypothetical protein
MALGNLQKVNNERQNRMSSHGDLCAALLRNNVCVDSENDFKNLNDGHTSSADETADTTQIH